MENKTAIGFAIGKIILMGEHAVVYGEPALAIPFMNTKIKVTISRRKGPVLLNCFFYKGILSDGPEKISGLKVMVKEIIKNFNEELKDFTIDIESSIPAERGMGSSAAVSVATIRALYEYFNYPLTEDDLIKWTDVSEKITHGNPSGLDAAIIIGERSLYFIKGRPLTSFNFNLKSYLIVADTGEIGQTREAVKNVKNLIETSPKKAKALIKDLGALTNRAKISMDINDSLELGKLMTKAHNILKELGVSNPSLDNLVDIALDNGSLGAKLTGGGRGGCMIALASSRESAEFISNQLLNKGAQKTWISNMEYGVDSL